MLLVLGFSKVAVSLALDATDLDFLAQSLDVCLTQNMRQPLEFLSSSMMKRRNRSSYVGSLMLEHKAANIATVVGTNCCAIRTARKREGPKNLLLVERTRLQGSG